MKKIVVQDSEISIISVQETDYISLTDMAQSQMQEQIIYKWMSLKSTIEYLGEWEMLYNPNFNYTEFGIIKNMAGSNSFVLSVKQWIEKTNAVGILAKTGRYGGTEWRDANPEMKGNIRDYANINQLICLSNMENLNAVFINKGMTQQERLIELNKIAIHQMKVLEGVEERRMLK